MQWLAKIQINMIETKTENPTHPSKNKKSNALFNLSGGLHVTWRY